MTGKASRILRVVALLSSTCVVAALKAAGFGVAAAFSKVSHPRTLGEGKREVAAFVHHHRRVGGIRTSGVSVEGQLEQLHAAVAVGVVQRVVPHGGAKAGVIPDIEQPVTIEVWIHGGKDVNGAFVGGGGVVQRRADGNGGPSMETEKPKKSGVDLRRVATGTVGVGPPKSYTYAPPAPPLKAIAQRPPECQKWPLKTRKPHPAGAPASPSGPSD